MFLGTFGQMIIIHDILVLVVRQDNSVLSLAWKVDGFIIASDLQAELDDVVLDGSPRESDRETVLVGDPLSKIWFQLQIHHEIAEITRFITLFVLCHVLFRFSSITIITECDDLQHLTEPVSKAFSILLAYLFWRKVS